MSHTHRLRHPARLAALASIAVVATSALAIPAAVGAGSTKWVTVSSGNVGSTVETPSIAKFGSGYEVVWSARPGANFALDARMLNAAGKPVGGVIDVQSGWTGINIDPTIFAIGSTRYIAFAGNKGSGPYSSGVEDYATSMNGKKWTLGTGSLTHSVFAATDTGTAVTNDAGTPITAMALNSGVTFHVGIDKTNRPAATPDKQTSQKTFFPSAPGVGRDARSHAVWAVWASGDGGNHKDGVWAQQILPTVVGSPIHAPDSFAAGGTTSFGVQQDLSAASRIGGGLYTAYVTPASRSVAVWKIGAKKPLATFKDLNGPSDVVVVAAPAGRIWAYWRDGAAWHAARSNRAATRFGPVTTLSLPKNTSSNFAIAAVGSAGPLEAVGLTTTASNVNEVIARQVLPRLSVSVSAHAVKRGHSFTVKVTDAGDPVKGATVHFGKAKRKTGRKGTAKFKVSHHTSLGKHAVTFTMGGYAAASTHIVIKK